MLGVFAVGGLLLAGIVFAQTSDVLDTSLERIFLKCRHRGGPSQSDDLIAYADRNGFSPESMATMLVAFAKSALETPDSTHRQLAEGALWGLLQFGGTKETPFVLQILRQSEDGNLRLAAISVGMRLDSANWEKWVEEACSNNRFSSIERFIAYEEAYRIGKNGDEGTRQRVEKVLSELAEQEENSGNKNRLQRWSAELKKR